MKVIYFLGMVGIAAVGAAVMLAALFVVGWVFIAMAGLVIGAFAG